ncbi:MAG TPA: bifunctional 4-hydroxy-2-oxoglutarate aldolase/2-dehydro-3-deoxy-phosphogluconate aldolase [Polyangiaceae bacterium]|jgi:2-dehydro-3-deoxyphosphogluconate aldolase/(4S)-4-hydroxy-2-oxoglutarate aldolase|nr:bifunctional 4-hydroxy-2-oxoglutarate aldolase/2-dehydro-3-deoxy-phosphogluconate aldolase [Polyangiaceae bacterium]
MNRVAICRRIEHTGIVPVIRANNAEQAFFACRALHAGGIDVLEITMTVPDATTVIRELVAQFQGEVLVGAGTVLDAETARACIRAGAEFIVSPGFDPEIVRVAHQAEKPALPGALTPSEIMAATRAGADMIKLFPVSALGGVKYLRSLRAPFEYVRFLPTGGVNASTARAFIAAGAVALGVGSELVDPEALARGDSQLLASRARELINEVRVARQELASGVSNGLPAPKQETR